MPKNDDRAKLTPYFRLGYTEALCGAGLHKTSDWTDEQLASYNRGYNRGIEESENEDDHR